MINSKNQEHAGSCVSVRIVFRLDGPCSAAGETTGLPLCLSQRQSKTEVVRPHTLSGKVVIVWAERATQEAMSETGGRVR